MCGRSCRRRQSELAIALPPRGFGSGQSECEKPVSCFVCSPGETSAQPRLFSLDIRGGGEAILIGGTGASRSENRSHSFHRTLAWVMSRKGEQL